LQLFDFIEADFGNFIVFEFFLMTCVSVVNISSQETQKNVYFKELFRFHHVLNAVKTRNGTPRSRIKFASANFGISDIQLRKFLGLSEDYAPDPEMDRLKTAAEMALVRTAEHFKVSPGRISNLVIAK